MLPATHNECIDTRRRHDGSPAPPAGRLMLLLNTMSATGGAELQSVALALGLKSRGWNVKMASLLPPHDALPALQRAGIAVESAHMRKGPSAALAIPRLLHLIRSFQPHVLHCHSTQAILAGRVTRPLTRVPVLIGTLHSLMMYSTAGRHQIWLERFHRLTDLLADATTVVCQAGLLYYCESKTVSPLRLRYIPNGVDLEKFRIDASQRLRVRAELGLGEDFAWLCIGRFDPIKDHRTTLASFARMLERVPHARLLLAGGGVLEPDLRAHTRTLGVADRVHFLGRRHDVPALMNAADGLILTSKYEALPLVLLEAAACGLPVVATHVGGNEEIIWEGETGYLAPVGDSKMLASAMAHLAALPKSERVRMGTAARNHVERHYHIDRVIDQWDALYRDLLHRKNPTASDHDRARPGAEIVYPGRL